MIGVVARPPVVPKAHRDVFLSSEMPIGRMNGWMEGEDLM